MKDRELHFGLFTFTNEPKLAAMAIRNLTSILRHSFRDESRSANPPLAAGSIAIELSQPDQGTPVLSLILAKEDGSKLVALWRETPIWDTRSGRPLEAPPIQAVVAFDRACADVRSYDPLRSSDPTSVGKGNSAALSVTDHVQLVECSP